MAAHAITLLIFVIFSPALYSASDTDGYLVDPAGVMRAAEETERQKLFEGDMKLSQQQLMQLHSRKFIPFESYLWTEEVNGNGIPYAIDDDVYDSNAILKGIAHWENKTCVKFISSDTVPTGPHLRFISSTGCWAYLGRRSNGNIISIARGCTLIGTVAHEIGHALGMFHEQSRSDRDMYVEVIPENIEPGYEHNFDLTSTNNYNTPYNFYSMMHYKKTSFSTNGLPTLRAKTNLPEVGVQMGQRLEGFSYYDELQVNTAYGCLSKWLTDCSLSANPCVNGYVGKNCECVCRPGTNGTLCDVEYQSYDRAVVDSDSLLEARTITTPQTITSFDFPVSIPYTRQNTLITAPECHQVVLTFEYFNLYTICQYERLEIRTDLNQITGNVYCGTSIAESDEFRSVGREMMLYESYISKWPGWSANVTFEEEANCVVGTSTIISTNPTTTEAPTSPTDTSTIATTTEAPTSPTDTSTIATTTEAPTSPTDTSTIATTTEAPTSPTDTSTIATTTEAPTSPTDTSTIATTTDTSTIPTTSISTEAPEPMLTITQYGSCNLTQVGENQFLYQSPDFPALYRQPFNCTLEFSSPTPCSYLVEILEFQRKRSLFQYRELTSYSTKFGRLPEENNVTLGLSTSAISYDSSFRRRDNVSFELQITVSNETDNRIVNLQPDDKFRIDVQNYSPGTFIEYWFRAPADYQLMIDIKKLRVGRSTRAECERSDYVRVDLDGDPRYGNSKFGCRRGEALTQLFSQANAMNVYLNGRKGTRTSRFRAIVSVLPVSPS